MLYFVLLYWWATILPQRCEPVHSGEQQHEIYAAHYGQPAVSNIGNTQEFILVAGYQMCTL